MCIRSTTDTCRARCPATGRVSTCGLDRQAIVGVTGVLSTIDLLKRDIEVKVLLGCSPAEIEEIQAFFIRLEMRFVLQVRS